MPMVKASKGNSKVVLFKMLLLLKYLDANIKPNVVFLLWFITDETNHVGPKFILKEEEPFKSILSHHFIKTDCNWLKLNHSRFQWLEILSVFSHSINSMMLEFILGEGRAICHSFMQHNPSEDVQVGEG